METPSSTRMVTRSQARAVLTNSSTHHIPVSKNGEENEKKMQTSRPRTGKQDRCVLIDITNDSPIVGLAGKSSSALFQMETPLSSLSKQRRRQAPGSGSGEALLRGQVKTLLQKVEQEAQISTFLGSIATAATTTHAPRNQRFLGLHNSPMMGILLAPTPANTPHIPGSGSADDEDPVLVADLFAEYPIEDKFKISQVVSDLFDGKMAESSAEKYDADKSLITRSLLFDFSEDKSDLSTVDEDSAVSDDCSSVMTYQSGKEREEEEEEEDASIWSIQVNASTRGVDEDIEIEDDEEEDEIYEDEEEEGYEEEEDDDGAVDELCQGMSKISVGDGVRFEGKHTRFVYNAKDEIEGEEEVVHLKGVPTPKGKHLRFEEEDEEEDA